MKCILSFFFAFSFFVAIGQSGKPNKVRKIDISTYLEKIYDSLKNNKVSNFISVEKSFYGMHILDSLGGPSIYYYLFWQTDTTTCFQEIKYYYPNDIIRNRIKFISNSEIFPLMVTYFDSIRTEELLPFIMKTKFNGIESYSPLMSIHKGYYNLLFYSKSEMIHKTFEDSYLQENIGPEHPNLNYRYNNSTKLMLIWNKLWESIRNELY